MLTRYEYSVKQTKLEPENFERRINIPFLFTTRQLSSASYGQVLMWIDILVFYSTFQANPAKTGGLTFVTLISFPKLHFLHQT